MFIRQLNYLIALDKYRHFGRTAESCRVSQPALSNGIRELERERVISWVHQVLASLEGLKQEADLVCSVPRGHLAIGVIPTASHAATILCAEYRDLLPQLTLEVMSLSTPEILQRLKSHNLHLGMLYDRSIVGDEHDVLPLFTERYVLIAGEQSSLPHELSWAEVANLPVCLLSQDMQNRQTLEEHFRIVDATPNVVLETNSLRVLLAECRSERAFSVIPLSALPSQHEGGGLRAHPIAPEHAGDVCLVRLRRETQAPLSDAAWKIASTLDLEPILNK